MSDDKNLKDDLNDMLGDAKEKAKDFAEEAKETASEFTENAKETFASDSNKKIIAGVLAILLGAFGVHKFILGYNKEGLIMLGVTIVLGAFTCGAGASLMGLIGLIEGIVYLTKSDDEFYNTYQVGKKTWF
jgi:TM2 domain-containing membrane protein YozV